MLTLPFPKFISFIYSEYTTELAKKLESKYGVSVIQTDCSNLSIDDINSIFGKLLYEFPIEHNQQVLF